MVVINAPNMLLCSHPPVAQWIEQSSSKALMGVRFPPGGQMGVI